MFYSFDNCGHHQELQTYFINIVNKKVNVLDSLSVFGLEENSNLIMLV